MPVPYISKVHEKTKIPTRTLEHRWESAKKAAAVETGDQKGWGVVMTIFKKMVAKHQKES